MLTWISQHPIKGQLLWVDDELLAHRDDVNAAVLNASGLGVKLVPISTKGTGLTDEHLRRVLTAAQARVPVRQPREPCVHMARGAAAHMEVMETPQNTPDQHRPIYEHLDMTTINRQICEALWARDIGAEAAAASPLSAQSSTVREQYFDLVTFIIRHIGPVTGDLGHRLGAAGKPNPFVSNAPTPVPAAELAEDIDTEPTQAETDAASMREALDNMATMDDAKLWAGFGLKP